ncbi:hypothetical protein [Streptomyces chryseus]|uniref:hypothetical protein n=1 Tax=Streptomyces chryseus TaxID=68186 RepID=UPI00110FAEAB|nr:hypothetical protein [Streptomyces chryseus]GGX01856.1 hypothetical protein GCM10010353_16830 [Streptomyces chryseus]
MAEIGYAQLPVPGGGDAPVGPGNLAALATAIDPHLVHHATNLADRNSRFATAPVHTLVSAENGALWKKTSSTTNTWITVVEPVAAWRPIALASGFTSSGGYTPGYRIDRGQVHMRGRIERINPLLVMDGGSGLTLAAVPSDAVPDQLSTWAGCQSMTGDPITGVCRMEAATNIVFWSQDGTGAAWVDISGSYWLS